MPSVSWNFKVTAYTCWFSKASTLQQKWKQARDRQNRGQHLSRRAVSQEVALSNFFPVTSAEHVNHRM